VEHALEALMLDRQKVETILMRRFAGAPRDQVAAAANAIMGLDEEWEEVVDRTNELGYNFSVQCADICYLAREAGEGAAFRLFRRRDF
jgi:hypothetical protein